MKKNQKFLFVKGQNAFKKGAVVILCSVMCFIAVSCKKTEPSTDLQGTKWKLEGYVNVATGTMIEAEPKDCERCYTLAFDTDSTAVGRSFLNEIWITLKPVWRCGQTEVDDSENGNAKLFYEAIEFI